MNRVRPTTILLLAAIAAFLASWLAPVFSGPDPSTALTTAVGSTTYRGYRVFWTVLGLLWSPDGPDGWRDTLSFALYVASSLTNLVFVVAVAALLAGWLRAIPALQWLVLASAVLDVPSAFVYMAKTVRDHQFKPRIYWLGMNEVAALEPKPGLEPTTSHLASVLETLQRQPAKMVLRAAYQSDRASQWVAERAKINAVALPFTVGGDDEAKDLFSYFEDTIQRLLKGAA